MEVVTASLSMRLIPAIRNFLLPIPTHQSRLDWHERPTDQGPHIVKQSDHGLEMRRRKSMF
jgi:hypothetical protein